MDRIGFVVVVYPNGEWYVSGSSHRNDLESWEFIEKVSPRGWGKPAFTYFEAINLPTCFLPDGVRLQSLEHP